MRCQRTPHAGRYHNVHKINWMWPEVDGMRIWFDVLTPKQVLFFESMIQRSERNHTVLFTTRDHREVQGLTRIRNLDPVVVGSYKGSDIAQKLDASLARASILSQIVQDFKPDMTVSFCSPEASRVSYGLGIPHIAFCDSPHAEATCRLSVPLLARLLIPDWIPKSDFVVYGFDPKYIIQYEAIDASLIIKNKPAGVWDKTTAGLHADKKTILFRTYESHASYIQNHTDMYAILQALATAMYDCNIVVLGRYESQIKDIKETCGDHTIILDEVVDSGTILAECDLFVGSGGTMTAEAALRGIPTISYEAIPNVVEYRLVKEGYITRAKNPDRIVETARRLLSQDPNDFRRRSESLVSSMKDPYDTLVEQIEECLRTG